MRIIIFLFYLVLTLNLNAQYTFEFHEGNENYDKGVRFFPTDDKGYLIFADWNTSIGSYGSNVFMAKFDSLGTIQWSFDLPYIGYEFIYDVEKLNDGDFYVYGTMHTHAFLYKITPTGVVLSRKIWNEAVSTGGSALRQISDTTIVTSEVLGFKDGIIIDSSRVALTLRDTSTDIIWQKSYVQYDYTQACQLISLKKMQDGNLLWAYTVQDSAVIEKVSLTGTTIWRKVYYRNHAYPMDAQEMPDGKIIFSQGVKLIAFDSNANTLWEIPNFHLQRIGIIDNNSFYAIGYLTSWPQAMLGVTPTYICKIDMSGTILNHRLYDDYYVDVEQVSATPDGGFAFIAGKNKPGSVYYDVLFYKGDTNYFYIGMNEEINSTMDFTVYPNPIEEGKTLYLNTSAPKGKVIIHDLIGNLIHADNIYTDKSSIQLPNIKSGVYLVTYESEDKRNTQKLIIQHSQ